jgi:hypothetical protein
VKVLDGVAEIYPEEEAATIHILLLTIFIFTFIQVDLVEIDYLYFLSIDISSPIQW